MLQAKKAGCTGSKRARLPTTVSKQYAILYAEGVSNEDGGRIWAIGKQIATAKKSKAAWVQSKDSSPGGKLAGNCKQYARQLEQGKEAATMQGLSLASKRVPPPG